MPTETKKKPVHEVRMGRIKAVVWENKNGDGVVRHNVQLRRIYKDEKGDWQASDSFGRDDLQLLGKVADKAQDWIFEQGKEKDESN